MFLLGRLEGFASVIKFSKFDFNIQWKVIIGNMDNDIDLVAPNTNVSATHMTEILSAVQP
jgi:metallophosphoesterase superfamily enzyme